MKTKTNSILAILFLTTTAMFSQWGNRVTGDGNITTKTVNVSSYDQVSLVGSMDVTLMSGTEGSIEVTTDDNLHQYLDIENEGGNLVLKMQKNVSYKSKYGIKIKVPVKEISRASVTGSGDMLSKTAINANDFEAKVTGSGNLSLNLNVHNLEAKITGSGNFEVEGKTDNLAVKVTGSGDFRGKNLNSTNANATVSGSGNATFTVTGELEARVNGSGDIRYASNPTKKDTKSNGSGKISSL